MSANQWFIDQDGDLGVYIEGKAYVMYKWGNPVEITEFKHTEVTFLDDSNTKPLWRKIQKACQDHLIEKETV